VAGLGEFIEYALRLVFGYLADRTKAYWPLTIIGYGLLLSVPLLAFAGYWQLAVFLIILERMGKAIRTPARDTMLSHATKQIGRGWGFGIHETLDQVGAIIGPLIFSAVFLLKGGYREGFIILWIPALLTLAALIVARIKVPSPEKLKISGEITRQNINGRSGLPRVFWFYTLFTFLSVGFSRHSLLNIRLPWDISPLKDSSPFRVTPKPHILRFNSYNISILNKTAAITFHKPSPIGR